MQAVLPSRNRFLQRGLPIACGGAAAGLAVVVAMNDPSAADSHFPQCVFRTTTGLWCPGCGLTRGLHQLFNGQVGSALSYNLFVPLVVVAAAMGWWSWMRISWGKAPLNFQRSFFRPLAWAMPVALIAYGVLRNIPTAPFDALAP